MAKVPTGEIFTTLKGYLSQLSEGERTPTEVASALNGWARESAESIKAKIAEEVESQVTKMGFVKVEEYEKLAVRVTALESQLSASQPKKRSALKKVSEKGKSAQGKSTQTKRTQTKGTKSSEKKVKG